MARQGGQTRRHRRGGMAAKCEVGEGWRLQSVITVNTWAASRADTPAPGALHLGREAEHGFPPRAQELPGSARLSLVAQEGLEGGWYGARWCEAVCLAALMKRNGNGKAKESSKYSHFNWSFLPPLTPTLQTHKSPLIPWTLAVAAQLGPGEFLK
ncbi:unnamed protein product [Pleuronectes platessa]|uniref:Uncharacterized protein n=1 Tax=Pleuronectes platessa TaxID=8262 RepID=A0A9N7TR86_PLEPL|nr:unnamed protein product [Pleuronectes platessa]